MHIGGAIRRTEADRFSRPQDTVTGAPEVLDKTFIGVDCGCEHRHHVRQAVQDAGKEMTAEVGHVGDILPLGVDVRVVACEHVVAFAVN